MAMGTKKGRERQEEIWYRSEVAEAPGHPFYRKLEGMLKEAGFDNFAKGMQALLCRWRGQAIAGSGRVLPADADRFL
jgi:hypothetical protein